MSSKKPSKSKPKKTTAKKPPAARREAGDPDVIDVSKLGNPLMTYNRSLPVVLTPSEYDERGHEAGTLSAEIKALEADKRAKNEAINAELKKRNARLDQVHGQLNTRTEDREIEVSVYADLDKGLKLTVRMDTGKILGRDKMSPAEKRGDVEVKPPAPPADEPKATPEKKGRKVKKATDAAPPADEAPASDGEAADSDDEPKDDDGGNGADDSDSNDDE